MHSRTHLRIIGQASCESDSFLKIDVLHTLSHRTSTAGRIICCTSCNDSGISSSRAERHCWPAMRILLFLRR